MALYSTELDSIRYQLGYPVVRIGAEPLIGYAAVFDRAIAPYLTDTGTTSSTAVAAAPSSTPVSVAVTLADATGFQTGSSAVVDVGPSQEFATVESVVGSVIRVSLLNAHGTNGAYPVVLNGAEQVVRQILARIAAVEAEMRYTAPTAGGVKAVDEVEFFGAQGSRGRGQRSKIDDLVYQRAIARDDLADAIGVPNLRNVKRGGGSRVELY